MLGHGIRFMDPVRLSDLVPTYCRLLRCSPIAAAWQLRESFATLGRYKAKRQGVTHAIDSTWCRIGAIGDPHADTPYSHLPVKYEAVIDYFNRNYEAKEPSRDQELIDIGRTNQPIFIPAAAVVFNRPDLTIQLTMTEWFASGAATYAPPSTPPKGRRLDTVRRIISGLMVFAATAARKSPDDPFCQKAAILDPENSPTASARQLHQLAEMIGWDDLPRKETIKDIL